VLPAPAVRTQEELTREARASSCRNARLGQRLPALLASRYAATLESRRPVPGRRSPVDPVRDRDLKSKPCPIHLLCLRPERLSGPWEPALGAPSKKHGEIGDVHGAASAFQRMTPRPTANHCGIIAGRCGVPTECIGAACRVSSWSQLASHIALPTPTRATHTWRCGARSSHSP